MATRFYDILTVTSGEAASLPQELFEDFGFQPIQITTDPTHLAGVLADLAPSGGHALLRRSDEVVDAIQLGEIFGELERRPSSILIGRPVEPKKTSMISWELIASLLLFALTGRWVRRPLNPLQVFPLEAFGSLPTREVKVWSRFHALGWTLSRNIPLYEPPVSGAFSQRKVGLFEGGCLLIGALKLAHLLALFPNPPKRLREVKP